VFNSDGHGTEDIPDPRSFLLKKIRPCGVVFGQDNWSAIRPGTADRARFGRRCASFDETFCHKLSINQDYLG
jgi:hypothetical protein